MTYGSGETGKAKDFGTVEVYRTDTEEDDYIRNRACGNREDVFGDGDGNYSL